MPALDVFSRRSRALKGPAAEAWGKACNELGLTLTPGSGQASGRMGYHHVAVSLTGDAANVATQYTVRLDTPHAPSFSLKHSAEADVRTFEGSVVIETTDEQGMLDFLTTERRVQILAALRRWDAVTMTAAEAVVTTPGIQMDSTELVSSIKQLVELAAAVTPCWAEVALDEGSVLDDLFNSDRDLDELSDRFQDLYKAGEICWTGEVVQVGDVTKAGRLVMVLLGSASGTAWSSNRSAGTMWGGRVVAMTTIEADATVQRGDILTVTGELRNLDTKRRMFQIKDLDTW